MKRIVSVLLSVCIIASLVVYAEQDKTTADCTKELALLEYIGAYSAPKDNTAIQGKMTRAVFVGIIAGIIGASEQDSNVYYLDVDRDNPYVSSVNAMREMGILSNSEQYFRPDDAITYAEAAKIVLSVAGYDVYANAVGGFPSGYLKTATKLSLLSGCADPNGLTCAEAVIMIYNAFTTGIYDIKTVDSELNSTYAAGGETVFSVYRRVYVNKGVLTANDVASVDGAILDKNQVIIDGVKYDIDENIYTNDRFLDTVEFFYEEQDENTKYVFYMENADSKSGAKDLTVTSEELQGFAMSSYTISYYSSGNRVNKCSFPRNSVVYYNGSEYTGSLSGAFNEFLINRQKGFVRLKDMDRDGKYDTVIIKAYRNMVVNLVDEAKGIYYNMADYNDFIQIKDYIGVSVKNSALQKADLSITTPSVLQVAESKDKRFIEIIICNDKVNGTVESIRKTGDGEEVTIDGKSFMVDSTYSDKLPTFISGNAYTVILDTYGYAAYAERTLKTDYLIGLLTDCISKTEAFTRKVVFKIYENGSEGVKRFDCADTIRIDGKRYKLSETDPFYAIPGSDGSTASGGSNIEHQAIRYKINDEGQVCEIDTYIVGENEDENNTLTKIDGPFGFNRYYNRYARLGTSVLRDHTNTIMFARPRTDKNGYLLSNDAASGYNYSDDCYVLNEAGGKIPADDTMFYNEYFIPLEQWAMLDVYKFNPDTAYADILIHTYESYLTSTDCFVFDYYGEKLDSNGDAVSMVACYKAAEKKEYSLLSTEVEKAKALKRGDLFRCSLNEQTGEIRNIQIVYDCVEDVFYGEDGKKREYTESGDAVKTIKPDFWYSGQVQMHIPTNKVTSFEFYRNFQLTKGAVIKRTGKALFVDWDGDYSTYEEAVDFSNLPLVVIDTKVNGEKGIYTTQPEQVADYKSVGQNCARIVVHNAWLTAKCGYVYIR